MVSVLLVIICPYIQIVIQAWSWSCEEVEVVVGGGGGALGLRPSPSLGFSPLWPENFPGGSSPNLVWTRAASTIPVHRHCSLGLFFLKI